MPQQKYLNDYSYNSDVVSYVVLRVALNARMLIRVTTKLRFKHALIMFRLFYVCLGTAKYVNVGTHVSTN